MILSDRPHRSIVVLPAESAKYQTQHIPLRARCHVKPKSKVNLRSLPDIKSKTLKFRFGSFPVIEYNPSNGPVSGVYQALGGDGYSPRGRPIWVRSAATYSNFLNARKRGSSDMRGRQEASDQLDHSSTEITKRVYYRKAMKVKPIK